MKKDMHGRSEGSMDADWEFPQTKTRLEPEGLLYDKKKRCNKAPAANAPRRRRRKPRIAGVVVALALLAGIAAWLGYQPKASAQGEEVGRFEYGGAVSCVVFSPDGSLLAVCGFSPSVQLISTASGKEVARVPINHPINSVFFSPDGRWLVALSQIGSSWLIETASGKEVASIGLTRGTFAFSPDSRLFAVARENTSITFAHDVLLIETASGNVVDRRTYYTGPVFAVAFSPNGRLLATANGGADGLGRLIDMASRQEVARIAPDDLVRAAAFSPDLRLLATAGSDNAVRLLEAGTGKELTRHTISNEVGVVAVFSPQARLLAAWSEEGNTVRLIEVETGVELARIANEGPVNAIVFSPDGRFLTTWGGNTAHLVETTSGAELARLSLEANQEAVAFSPDGALLATGNRDGTVRLLHVNR